MATTTRFTEPIPDRRRTRFATNGGRRLTAAERRRAKQGLVAAREALAATEPGQVRRDVVRPIPDEQRESARRGLDAARRKLSA